MTTAARPTLTRYDNKAPTLQYRKLTKEELKNIDLKEELLKAKREHFEKIQGKQLREAGAAGDNQYAETQHQLLLETAALDKDDSE
ncbi:Cwf15/Cwc15 cell cycle control protein [Gigaspora margarita]|uniref:Cwf15/Cwc15 cell cycle control protein n=1 Tax=Gigaspora margarita TaxID=4874 RepID=A0A8H3WTU2_GIGMA|nr:Cwf15/Cwc15 cell cycle control protein [Gigaspora margarita]